MWRKIYSDCGFIVICKLLSRRVDTNASLVSSFTLFWIAFKKGWLIFQSYHLHTMNVQWLLFKFGLNICWILYADPSCQRLLPSNEHIFQAALTRGEVAKLTPEGLAGFKGYGHHDFCPFKYPFLLYSFYEILGDPLFVWPQSHSYDMRRIATQDR